MSILVRRASDVRITEIDLSQVITSESSATACQIIVSNQGSTQKKRFTNAQDFLAEYGNPNARISFDGYTALDFFREGNQLWGMRVVNDDAKYSSIVFSDNTGVTRATAVSAGVSNPEMPSWSQITPVGQTPLFLVYPARGPGSYANSIAVAISSNNVGAPTNLAANSSITGGSLVAGTYEYQISAITSNGETLATAPVQIVISGVAVTNSVTLTWDPVPNAIGYRIYGRATTGFGLLSVVGSASFSFVDAGIEIPDADHQPIESANDLPTPSNTFIVQVFDLGQSDTYPIEQFECSLTEQTDDTGSQMEIEQRINPFSQYIRVKSNASALLTIPPLTPVSSTTMDGGDSGTAPTNFQIAAAWDTFRDTQRYDVNCLINAGRTTPTVQRAMDALAQSRGDAVALLDTPSTAQSAQSAIDYRNLTLNLNSSYSALFCPDVLESDNINGKTLYVPFSGWAAALCARTDRVANPAFSIAGLNRGLIDVLATRYSYDDGEATNLFKAQVNYTRSFIGQGTALWEQQTLQAKQSALSWLSVRRILNVIKVSCYKFLLYSLQEPNDDFTRRQIVGALTDYLSAVQNARGITAFSVISDATNNTPAMANSGTLKVTILVTPSIPIHEIQLDVVITKQGVNFEEIPVGNLG